MVYETQPSLSPFGTQLWNAARRIARLEYEVKRLEDQRDALVEIIKQVLTETEANYKYKLSFNEAPSTSVVEPDDTVANFWWNGGNGDESDLPSM